MNQGERALLAGASEVGYAGGSTGGWNRLWQNAVGRAMGREAGVVSHVDQDVAATIRAELTR